MNLGGTGDPRAEVLRGLSILGKGPEKQLLAGGERGFWEFGSVREIRATVDRVVWEGTLRLEGRLPLQEDGAEDGDSEVRLYQGWLAG